MRQIRSFLPLLCLALLYWGCQKADNPATRPSTAANNTVNTVTIYSPEHVVINSTPLPLSSKVETDATNVEPATTVVYEGYTKTYSCTSNTWTYVYTWGITLFPVDGAPSGTGQLTIGSYTTSAAFTILEKRYLIALPCLPHLVANP